MSHFRAARMGSCDVCGKPATHALLGPGNTPYGHTCGESHAKKRIAELEKAWRAPSPDRKGTVDQ